MTTHGIDANIDRQIKILKVLCLAFASSLLVYVGLAWILVEVVGLEPMIDRGTTIPTILTILGLGMLPAAEMTTRALWNRATPGQQAASPDVVLQAYSQAMIVGSAMREGCGVIGLVLSILTANWLWAAGLSFLALVAMLLAWPRSHSVEDWLLQHPGVRRS